MNTQDIKKSWKDVSESKAFRVMLYVFGILIVASVAFQAGIFVGYRRASFGRDWDRNYSDNFGTMRRGPGMIGGTYDRLPNAGGAIGKIIKSIPPTIIVLDRDGTEKVILLAADTRIRTQNGTGTQADLTLDSYVTVIGSPNAQGQIEAKFIRITPAPLGDADQPMPPVQK